MMGRSPVAECGRSADLERKVRSAQNISRMCLVCGDENLAGLHGSFYELDGGELLGVFRSRKEHQSYPGRLHGGISSAVLDETIGRAITITHPGTWGVTAELTVRFRRPVPLDGTIRAIARITRDTSRLFEGSGEIVLDDGAVAVEARGKYVKMPLDAITDEEFDKRDWFADPREAPDSVEL
jgi:uncharacterized protein (TIGR00369 family)